MALPYTSKSVLTALQNLSQQTNRVEREAVLKAGLKEILKWFTLAAKNIIENEIKLPKQTTTFMKKHREEIQRLADPSIDEEIKRKIILKPGGGGFLGSVIIRSLLRWDGSKTARKFGDRHPRKRAPRKKKTSKEKSSKKTSSSKKSSKKKSSKKKSSKKRTSRQNSPSTSVPISSPNTSHMDVSMSANLSPIPSPRNSLVGAPVVAWSGQNTSNHFGIAESHPRVDERFITMRKKRSSVSEHPRFPKSRKELLRDRLYDLKKKNRRFIDKKLQFQSIPSKTWSSWSASLREKYRQGKKEKAQLMRDYARQKIFFSSNPNQVNRLSKRLMKNSIKTGINDSDMDLVCSFNSSKRNGQHGENTIN